MSDVLPLGEHEAHSKRALAASIVLAVLPGVLGAPFVDRHRYVAMDKPNWAPPPAVFGPVWTALYASIGYAAWLVAQRGAGRGVRGIYLVQLALNGLWTPLFFGLRRPGVALAGIVALWLAVLANALAFGRVRARAGVVLLPYLAWVSFATVLNFSIWRRAHRHRTDGEDPAVSAGPSVR